MWLEIRFNNQILLVCTIYRPPNNGLPFWDNLQDMFDNVKQSHIKKYVILGDFNADDNMPHGNHLSNFIAANNLVSHVNEPTRITSNTQTCLDRIITNIPHYVYDTEVIAPLLSNDHCTVCITLTFRISKSHCYKRLMWDYNRADFVGLNNHISHLNWDQICDGYTDIDRAADNWTNTLITALKQFIPNRIVVVRRLDKPWYTSDLRRQRRALERCHKRAKSRNNNNAVWAAYRRIRNMYIQNCRDRHSEYDQRQLQILSQSDFKTKNCWKLYRSILGIVNDHTCPSLLVQGNNVTDNKAKANVFNQLFVSKSTINDIGIPDPGEPIRNANVDIFYHVDVTLNDVTDQLSILDISKAYGPDEIGPRVLQGIRHSIAPSLRKLFNASLLLQKVPSIWKCANVTPIFKKGDKSNPANYRPISLLCSTGKILERIIFKYLFNHFRDNSIISIWQSGFMPQCSTVHQLVELYHNFCCAIDKGKEVRVVFLDISRAFDRVWHVGLLYKLRKAGIDGPLLRWLENYLKYRQQRVCLNGEYSDWGELLAGVPQGSILGPLLFLIFINDLTEVTRFCHMRLFADDTCVYLTIDNREQAGEMVNADLQAIHNWSKKWLVDFSAPKTKSLIVSNKHDREQNPRIEMNGMLMDEVQSHKHLGIVLHRSLKWSGHIDEIYIKAMRRLDVIQHLKFKLPRESLQRYYMSFVLPTLEYGDQLWDSACDQDLKKLDRVHVRAMRIITGATNRSSVELLYRDLGWNTLAQRRTIHRLKLYFKIMNNQTPTYLSDLMPEAAHERNVYPIRNRHDMTLFRTRSATFYKSFFPSTTRDWNNLPIVIRQAPCLHSFSRMLGVHFSPPAPKRAWFGCGNRKLDIYHARIRLGCSGLKAHLHFNLHVEENPNCICGKEIEHPAHYFFRCELYEEPRVLLLTSISAIVTPTTEVILHGDASLSLNNNVLIILAVQSYIESTQRFK